MKTTIQITGQINGNHRLANSINTLDAELTDTAFYGKKLVFPTKKQAKKAMWEAFKHLRREEPGITNKIGGISYSPGNFLAYDASRAELL